MMVVRSRLAEIIEARPDELSYCPGIVVLHRPIVIREIRPRAELKIVTRTLQILVKWNGRHLRRKEIFASARKSRCRFRTQHKSMRRSFIHRLVERQAISYRRHFHCRRNARFNRLRHPRKPLRHLALRIRIKLVTPLLQLNRKLQASFIYLLSNLVADRPHHNARTIAALLYQILQIALPPLVKEKVVPVFAFCLRPRIERFGHHHKAHLVANFQLLFARHIVRSANGVAAHLLQERQLASESIAVECRTQRS